MHSTLHNYTIGLIRVVDGDTVDAYIDLGFSVKVKKRIRLVGINSPESRTRDLEEKKRGLAAKERLKCLLKGCNRITLDSHGVGKFGRCLGNLFIDIVDGQEQVGLTNVNNLLLT